MKMAGELVRERGKKAAALEEAREILGFRE